MTDAEAQKLPVQIDSTTLDMAGMSTWMTDAGAFDVLAGLEASDGRLVSYEELANERTWFTATVSRSGLRAWRTLSKPRSGLIEPRTEKRYLNYAL